MVPGHTDEQRRTLQGGKYITGDLNSLIQHVLFIVLVYRVALKYIKITKFSKLLSRQRNIYRVGGSDT
jgi:hypothetical protein